MQAGQKIYVFNHETHEQLWEPIYGYIIPRPGELFIYFDAKTGIYSQCTVVRVTHGVSSKTNQLVSSIYVKLTKSEKE